MPLPPVLAVLLAALALDMAAVLVAALALAGPGRRRWAFVGLAVAAGYLGVSGALAASGALADLDARPPPAGLLLLALGGATVALAFSRVGDRLLRWPLAALVGAQAFRILVELWLTASYHAGAVPVEVTMEGLNFDVVSGVTAAALGLWLWRGSPPRWIVWAWNALGLALLVTVVALSTRSALGLVETVPRLALPAAWPGVWLPAWLVQLALLGHLLVFRALRQRRPGGRAARRRPASAERAEPA